MRRKQLINISHYNSLEGYAMHQQCLLHKIVSKAIIGVKVAFINTLVMK